jgi:hypothetical protein
MCALPVSSQTVVAYLGYLLEAGTISAKSLQTYLSVINAVHNDFEYPSPVCDHLVKLTRKGFAELQVSSMLQPQQVTAFPTIGTLLQSIVSSRRSSQLLQQAPAALINYA